jgi:hypothetical protein
MQTITIKSAPGIKRDGTKFEGDQYVDGEWVRFQRGLPRKIGGYRSINKFALSLPRAINEFSQDLQTYLHFGSFDRVERLFILGDLNTSVITDRTPLTGFTPDPLNLWQFAISYDTTLGNQIVAQVAPNLDCLCNSLGGELFVGDLLGTAPLTPVTSVPSNFNATGGVVALAPYTFVYGTDGYVAWSVPNAPDDFVGSGSGNAFVASQKIIKGMPLRGGPGNSPSGLFWSADAVVRATFTGGTTPIFQFDTISTQTSILSANSVIEYDGVFYWCGTDRFLMFNGVVREVENNMNLNFFFDNLNLSQRNKVFALKVPRYGEIWWCFPFGDSPEPNHAVIYNVRENTWYDTPLPNGGRGAGIFPTVFQKPIMTGIEPQNAVAINISVVSGGSGYTAGDTLWVQGGDVIIPAEITVDTVGGGGAILTASLSNTGTYRVAPSNPVSVTGGSGTLATFDIGFANPYKTWVHETGFDEVDGQIARPVRSFFETADLSIPAVSQVSRSTQVLMVEPDFVQRGEMTAQIIGRANARGPEVAGPVMPFPAVPSTPQEQVLYFKEQRRELRFRFESNTLGGDYQMGSVMAHVQAGDGTTIQ